jgi:hypothetical protein
MVLFVATDVRKRISGRKNKKEQLRG